MNALAAGASPLAPEQDGFDAFLAEMRSTPDGRAALEEGMRWVQEQFYGAAHSPAPVSDTTAPPN